MPMWQQHENDPFSDRLGVDRGLPYAAAGPLAAKLQQNGTLITYKDFPHGMPTTQAETINADLLAFIKR
jgi:non-heme chloroperoxidase